MHDAIKDRVASVLRCFDIFILVFIELAYITVVDAFVHSLELFIGKLKRLLEWLVAVLLCKHEVDAAQRTILKLIVLFIKVFWEVLVVKPSFDLSEHLDSVRENRKDRLIVERRVEGVQFHKTHCVLPS